MADSHFCIAFPSLEAVRCDCDFRTDMKRHKDPRRVLASALLVVAGLLFRSEAGEGTTPGGYEMGSSNLMQMAEEMALGTPRPAFLQTEDIPILSPVTAPETGSNSGTVCFSKGFVDLVNHVAHAKALDDDTRGFLKAYVAFLSTNGHGTPVPPPSFPDVQKAWSADTVNTQMGYFNQIGAGLMAVELACVKLGYHRKHVAPAGASTDKPTPLKASLTPREWQTALLTGATNAIMTGYNTPGLIAFYRALDQVKPKPAWADYFLPPNANVNKIARDLRLVEDTMLQKDNDLLRTPNLLR